MNNYIKYIIAALALCSAITSAVYAQDYSREVYIANPSFDDFLASWTYEGGGVSVTSWGLSNTETDYQLNLYPAGSLYTAAHKTIYSLAPGKYEISAYVRGGGTGTAYMYAKSGKTVEKNTEYSSSFAKKTVVVDVTDGMLEFGFVSENGTDLWYNADEVSVRCIEEYAQSCVFLENNSFDNGTEGYTVNGAQINENGRVGNCLSVPVGASASVSIENLENGFYEVSMSTKSNNADSVITAVSDSHHASARIPVSIEWQRTVLTDAYVSGGKLDISVVSNGDLCIDDISLKKVDKYRNFITGGDITEALYLEDNGAKYYGADGVEDDCVKILADSGVNMARVRAYTQTGKDTAIDTGKGVFYLPDGYQTTEGALELCRRAKENGMQIEFTFHYSDFWTNAERQEIPLKWKAQIDGKSWDEAVDILEKCVYDYTLDVMTKLKEQGTVPELVSVGNEIQFGMLYPYGYIGEDAGNWKYLARFLNAGYRAVKEVCPSTRVILHLDDCGNFAKYEDFFSQCDKNSVGYDIIGTSYYPYWSGKLLNHVTEFCNSITERFDKDIIVMETGYNFHPYKTPDHEWVGQLENNGPYEDIYPSTPEGHKQFMTDLFNALKASPRCIGDLYWDPIMIYGEGIGWAVNAETDITESNVVANTTLFDFDGKALPSLEVFADTKGADYSIKLETADADIKERFDAEEKNGRINIKNTSDRDENIIVFHAEYKDGMLSSVKIDRRVLKPGQDGSFENGRYTFAWTQDDIRPITVRR